MIDRHHSEWRGFWPMVAAEGPTAPQSEPSPLTPTMTGRWAPPSCRHALPRRPVPVRVPAVPGRTGVEHPDVAMDELHFDDDPPDWVRSRGRREEAGTPIPYDRIVMRSGLGGVAFSGTD